MLGRREKDLTPDEVQLKDDIEEFLSDVVSNRYWLRSRIGSDGEVASSIGKYLENPAWHDPIITAYLLVDLLDDELILLERDFHVGLFKGQGIDNQIGSTVFAYQHSSIKKWRMFVMICCITNLRE